MTPKRTTGDSAAGVATTYIKVLLFVYAATAPFLLRNSGASSDPRCSSALCALGCVAIAFGVGVLLYEGAESHGHGALGLLVAICGVITVVVVRGSRSRHAAPKPVGDISGQRQIFFLSQEPHEAPHEAHEAREEAAREEAPHEEAGGLLQEVAPPEYASVLEAMTVDAPGAHATPSDDDPNAADLERLFNAPSINEFLIPSPGGFVTPYQTEAIQSNSPGGSDTSSAVIMTLGAGSYSAQGATAVADVMGVP